MMLATVEISDRSGGMISAVCSSLYASDAAGKRQIQRAIHVISSETESPQGENTKESYASRPRGSFSSAFSCYHWNYINACIYVGYRGVLQYASDKDKF
jgi:hypothetical protein